jgi:hypothetical protein
MIQSIWGMDDPEEVNNLIKSNIGPVPSWEKHGSVSAVSAPTRSWDSCATTSTIPLLIRQAVNPANTKVRGYIGLKIFGYLDCFEVNELMDDKWKLKDSLL